MSPPIYETQRSASSTSSPCFLQSSASTPRRLATPSVASMESQFHIEPHILRGVQLHTSIRRCGYLWRRSPLELDETSRAHLYRLSEQRTNLDYFISHAWQTPGWAKHLSLLIFAIWQLILLSVAFTLFAVFVLLLRYDIPWDPVPDVFNAKVQGWQGQVVAHPGASVGTGVVVYAWVMIFSSKVSQFPAFGNGDCWAFLDVVCISQIDKDLQTKGVKSLAGFVSKSNEFLLLWSTPYFSRKWCVYEVAAFMKCHSHEKIIFQPVFMGTTALVGACMSFIGSALWVTFASFLAAARQSPLFVAPFVFGIGWGVNKLRCALQLQQIMHDQLANFDVNQARCREQADSDYIDRAIEQWYGGIAAFNAFVRTHLREHLLEKASVAHFSYYFCLLVNPFEPLVRVTYTAAYTRAGVPRAAVASLVIEIMGQVFCTGPLQMIITYMISTKLARSNVSPRCATFLSFVSGFFIVVCVIISTEVAVRARNFHIAASVGIAAVQVSVTWLVFCFLLPKYRSGKADARKSKETCSPSCQTDSGESACEDTTPTTPRSPTSVVPNTMGAPSDEDWFTPVCNI